MSSLIHGICFFIIPLPCSHTHNTASAIMVPCAEKSIERILASIQCRILKSHSSMSALASPDSSMEREICSLRSLPVRCSGERIFRVPRKRLPVLWSVALKRQKPLRPMGWNLRLSCHISGRKKYNHIDTESSPEGSVRLSKNLLAR